MFSAILPLLFAVVLLSSSAVDARQVRKDELRARQLEAAKRWNAPLGRREGAAATKNITFSNPKASGKHLNFYLLVYDVDIP